MGVSGQNSSERSKGQQKGVDVLPIMRVTAAVFHLEMSALNAGAFWNTVGRCRCRGGQNPKINKIEKT